MNAPGSRAASQLVPFAAILFAGVLLGSLTMRFVTPPPPPPPRLAAIDGVPAGARAPAVSPDGGTLVFAAPSGAGAGLFARPLEGGESTRLVAGSARMPRFTADGALVVFTRGDSAGDALWIVPAGGGAARRLVPDASDADPSPDGRWLAFVRLEGDGESLSSLVMVSDSLGGSSREIHREHGAVVHGPRWSPDGKRIAITVDARYGMPGRVLLLGVGEETRTLALPAGAAHASVGAWVDSKRYVYAIPVPGDARWPVPGSSLRAHHVKRDRSYEAAWVPGAVGLVETSPGGRLVFELAASDTAPGSLWRADRVPGLGRPSR